MRLYEIDADGKVYYEEAPSKAVALDYFLRCCPWVVSATAMQVKNRQRLEYIRDYCHVWRAEDDGYQGN